MPKTTLNKYMPKLRAAAARAARRFHADREEMLSEALWIFLLAERSRFRPLGPVLQHRLRRLADGPRRDARRSAILARQFVDLDALPALGRHRPARALWAVLGADAITVCRAALSLCNGREPRTVRAVLRHRFGNRWGAARYARAVAEIREVLQ